MVVEGRLRICGIQAVESCDSERARVQKVSDLGFAAAKKLIRALSWQEDEIRLLLLFTQTSDYLIPSTASLLQKRLQIGSDCLVYDVNAGADSFAKAFRMSDAMMNAMDEDARGILVFSDAYREDEKKHAVAVAVQRDEKQKMRIFGVSFSDWSDRFVAEEKYCSATLKQPIGEELIQAAYEDWRKLLHESSTDDMASVEIKSLDVRENHSESVLCELVKKYSGEPMRCSLFSAGAGVSVGGLSFLCQEKIYCDWDSTDENYDDLQHDRVLDQ